MKRSFWVLVAHTDYEGIQKVVGIYSSKSFAEIVKERMEQKRRPFTDSYSIVEYDLDSEPDYNSEIL